MSPNMLISAVSILVLLFVSLSQQAPVRSVCYEDLGCFSTNGTFKGYDVLPDSPEQLKVKFELFTRHNVAEGQVLDYTDVATVKTELFQSDKTTLIIIHGYMGGGLSDALSGKNKYLQEFEGNVIVVDWSKASKGAYQKASANSELVGRQIGNLVDLLRTGRKHDPNLVHLAGGSLGAHLAGFAGKWTTRQLGFQIGRITALDPAGLLFESLGPEVHLWKEDATFVDVIHSSDVRDPLNGGLGLVSPIGHVDFYPNGGHNQPGCSAFECSHLRSVSLFLESVSSKPDCFFTSVSCPGGYDSFRLGECKDCGPTGCGRMGLYSRDAPGRGVQFLDTNGKSPFCKAN